MFAVKIPADKGRRINVKKGFDFIRIKSVVWRQVQRCDSESSVIGRVNAYDCGFEGVEVKIIDLKRGEFVVYEDSCPPSPVITIITITSVVRDVNRVGGVGVSFLEGDDIRIPLINEDFKLRNFISNAVCVKGDNT